LQEIRAWITRRLLAALWHGMVDALKTQVRLDQPGAIHASDAIVGMEHAVFVQEMKESGGFSAQFESGIDELPLGEAPLLLVTVHFSQHARQPIRMNFVATDGTAFELALPPTILHSFCSMLKDAARPAGWGLDLELTTADAPPPSRLLN
jgi:hypothetical protein